MVIMIYRMMAQDLARFGTVFIIFVMGFSQAFFIIFRSFEFDHEVAEVDEGQCDDEEEAQQNSNCVVSYPLENSIESDSAYATRTIRCRTCRRASWSPSLCPQES